MRLTALKGLPGLIILILLVGGTTLVLLRPGPQYRTVTAMFAETPGLYAGNRVTIDEVPVGTITSVKASATGVAVHMRLPMHYLIPANAEAVLDAPQVVNDRAIELTPGYSGGPVMANHTVIPVGRTVAPLSTDQILRSLDNLLKALGPVASDKSGVLASLINTLNNQLGGQGTNFHNTIGDASGAVTALASDSPEMAATLTQLASFVQSAAADAGEYQQFTGNLEGAAADLNSDRGQLAAVLNQLDQTLGQITTFISANAGNLKGSLTNLQQAMGAVAANQQSLAQIIRVTPLLAQNLQNVVTPTPQGPALAGRFNPTATLKPLIRQMCGNTVQLFARAMTIFTEQTNAPMWNLLCIFGHDFASYAIPPGSPNGPNLNLQALFSNKDP